MSEVTKVVELNDDALENVDGGSHTGLTKCLLKYSSVQTVCPFSREKRNSLESKFSCSTCHKNPDNEK